MTTCGISQPFGWLSPTSGQVTYVLLTRSPLSRRTVRLACIRHAASVYPEPGSNSPPRRSPPFGGPCLNENPFLLPGAIQLLRCGFPASAGTPARHTRTRARQRSRQPARELRYRTACLCVVKPRVWRSILSSPLPACQGLRRPPREAETGPRPVFRCSLPKPAVRFKPARSGDYARSS